MAVVTQHKLPFGTLNDLRIMKERPYLGSHFFKIFALKFTFSVFLFIVGNRE